MTSEDIKTQETKHKSPRLLLAIDVSPKLAMPSRVIWGRHQPSAPPRPPPPPPPPPLFFKIPFKCLQCEEPWLRRKCQKAAVFFHAFCALVPVARAMVGGRTQIRGSLATRPPVNTSLPGPVLFDPRLSSSSAGRHWGLHRTALGGQMLGRR